MNLFFFVWVMVVGIVVVVRGCVDVLLVVVINLVWLVNVVGVVVVGCLVGVGRLFCED